MNQVQLGFGEVRHARLRPSAHAFSYGVYFLRLPLRTLGQQAFTTPLMSRNRFNLLSFHDRDHGDGKQALTDWVDALLQQAGIEDADGEIWLQTFPRVLGYVFNPVSFWFCHRADGGLRAIVCEVNSTFGERHCYLLEQGGAMPFGIVLQARKALHVSPFCKVEGVYRFRFMHAAPQGRNGGGRLNERVTARIDYDDACGPLLQTSVSGMLRPLTSLRVAHAFLYYPLMTFGVMARIHWQALQLWIKRVPFFRKPRPSSSETSR